MPRILWSHSEGRKAGAHQETTRVRVFERADSPGRLYIEAYWIEGPGRVRALKMGTTREGAKLAAKKLAQKREEALLRDLDPTGERRATTLFALLKAYHDPSKNRKARKWSERHQVEQERCRDFWKRELGDVAVTRDRMTASLVEGLASDAAEARGWSDRTEEKYLKYIQAATRWGKRKARLYEADPLAELELPEVRYDTRKRIYTPAEARKLSTLHPKVDWRVTLVSALSVAHGRRASSIAHLWAGREGEELEPDWVTVTLKVRDPVSGEERDVERMLLHYRAEYDKGGRDEWVPVPEQIRPVVEHALAQPQVQESGWLVPEGRLEFDDPRTKPMRVDSLIEALHAAEEVLKIPTVAGRGFHGLKRLHVTKGLQVAGGDASRVGDITGNVSEHVLKTIYRQKELAQMVQQVDAVGAEVWGQKGANTDTNEDSQEDA